MAPGPDLGSAQPLLRGFGWEGGDQLLASWWGGALASGAAIHSFSTRKTFGDFQVVMFGRNQASQPTFPSPTITPAAVPYSFSANAALARAQDESSCRWGKRGREENALHLWQSGPSSHVSPTLNGLQNLG